MIFFCRRIKKSSEALKAAQLKFAKWGKIVKSLTFSRRQFSKSSDIFFSCNDFSTTSAILLYLTVNLLSISYSFVMLCQFGVSTYDCPEILTHLTFVQFDSIFFLNVYLRKLPI